MATDTLNYLDRLRGRVTFCVAPTVQLALAFVDSAFYHFHGSAALGDYGIADVWWDRVDCSFAKLARSWSENGVKFVNVVIVGGPSWTHPISLRYGKHTDTRTLFVHSRVWLEWENAYTTAKHALSSDATVLFVQCDGSVPNKPPVDCWLTLESKSWALTPYSLHKFFGVTAAYYPVQCVFHDGQSIATSPLADWVTPHILSNSMLITKRESYYYNYIRAQRDLEGDSDSNTDDCDEGEEVEEVAGDEEDARDEEDAKNPPSTGDGDSDGGGDGKGGKGAVGDFAAGTLFQPQERDRGRPLQQQAGLEPAHNHANPMIRKDGTNGWVVAEDGARQYIPINAPCCDDKKDYDDVDGNRSECAIESTEKGNGVSSNSDYDSYGDGPNDYSDSDDLDSEELHFHNSVNAANSAKPKHIQPGTLYDPKPLTPQLQAQAARTYAAITSLLPVFDRSSNKRVPVLRSILLDKATEPEESTPDALPSEPPNETPA